MSEWTETKQVFHELEQLFNREDDVNDIQDIHKMQKEVAEHCEQRLNDVREIIKGKIDWSDFVLYFWLTSQW